jgi:hypothetical protein
LRQNPQVVGDSLDIVPGYSRAKYGGVEVGVVRWHTQLRMGVVRWYVQLGGLDSLNHPTMETKEIETIKSVKKREYKPDVHPALSVIQKNFCH